MRLKPLLKYCQIKLPSHRRHSGISCKPLKAFKPNAIEEDVYKYWTAKDSSQYSKTSAVFSMILPPPNVTGTLHLGHALTVCTQDALVRWKRMCGDEVIWIPGLDHAGIATQVVVEKYLQKEFGKSRFDLGKNKFIGKVKTWKNEKKKIINSQLYKLGASLDWRREVFTMDPAQADAVTEALITLWERGLVYRDETLINWSPHLRSAISDIEVEYVEVTGPTSFSLPGYSHPVTFGHMTDFAYKIAHSDEEVVVSTTRIETMLGDVAVAVNPEDARYRHLWGSLLIHPFNGSEIPLIIDPNVDPNFGTGAVKITPAHDHTDFLIAKSHGLTKLSVINEEGYLENCGDFSGLKRFDAREIITNLLKEKGLLRGIKSHTMKIPFCSRSGDVIELLIKPQWFIRSRGMAERAINALKNQEIIISPEKYHTNWINWLENIQDWCISRQLWWGHQAPFYSCEGKGNTIWVAAKSEEEASIKAQQLLESPVTVKRDSDVLDTWFSSALLPFSCFGWPIKASHILTSDLERYYPLDILVTGNDILLFWVARMVMLGLELTGKLPFKEVLLHGIVCDAQGRKMSKSLGNVIVPEDIIEGKSLKELTDRISNSMLKEDEIDKAKKGMEKLFPKGIPECGVDALRFTLLSHNIKNQYINFDVNECYGSRLFCNKLWQACNFTNDWAGRIPLDCCSIDLNQKYFMDEWILEKLNSMVGIVNGAFSNRDLHSACHTIRNFIHLDLCDVYIESIKPVLRRNTTSEAQSSLNTLIYTLNTSLKCLFPFMPFISEYLYQKLPGNKTCSLIEESFPSSIPEIKKNPVIEQVLLALNIVRLIRKFKYESGINQKEIQLWISSTESEMVSLQEVLETLGKCKVVLGQPNDKNCNFIENSVNENTKLYFDSTDCKKMSNAHFLQSARQDAMKQELQKLIVMTSNQGFRTKASKKVQKSHQDKIFRLKEQITKLEE